MRILVAGGAGFLGSHLVGMLVSAGHEVAVIDDFWTGREQNLAWTVGSDWRSRIHLERWDVAEAGACFDEDEKFDQIIHMASPASPPVYMSDPVRTMRANFLGALALLPLLKKGGLFCYTSTSEVYGDPEVSPLPEEYRGRVDCTGPRSSYDESKRATEALLHELHRTQGLRIRCSRIFNAYGECTSPDDGRAVSNFISAGLRDQPIVVHGDGLQTRCFGYVTDIVAGLYHYFMSPNEAIPTVMNIGNDHEVTVLEVAQRVAAKLGTTIEHGPPAPQDPHQRRPELSRSRHWIPAWNPHSIDLDTGIERTINFFRRVEGL